MSKWKIYTPEGVQDILAEECFTKKKLEVKIRDMFTGHGYYEIEPPTLEFYDTFSAEPELIPQETMFEFFDPQGRILVLRPDITIPVARIAATKYKDSCLPIKVCYIGNTFRYNELGGGKQKEFTQAGVEILGAVNPEADAEVIATAINTLKASGIKQFQVEIGQVDFFKGLIEDIGLNPKEIKKMCMLIDNKDFFGIGIERIINSHGINEELKQLILELPRLFGSVDIIDRVSKYPLSKRSLKALENLRKVVEILDDYGLTEHISIDLGMIQNLNYYSGIIFKGFTYGVGFPVLTGGRYDGLIEKYGKNCAATGFCANINLIMMALDRHGIKSGTPSVFGLVCYSDGKRKDAVVFCDKLRALGFSAELNINSEPQPIKYAESKNVEKIFNILVDNKVEIFDVVSGSKHKESIDELIAKLSIGGKV